MNVAKFLISPLLAVTGLLKGPKAPDTSGLGPVTRDSVRDAADANDALRRRRGGAADIVTGAFGAEPATVTGKDTLGS